MGKKTDNAIDSLVNGLVQYVDNKIQNIPYVKTDVGKVKSVTLTNNKYLHTVTVRGYDYTNIKSIGNNEFTADSVVYILVPNGQYSNMFILGHLDDTNANIKGGTINIGDGNFVVDENGNVTIKYGNIDIDTLDLSGYYNKTEVDNLLGDKADISSLANVAFSGSYTDLINKPTIPTKTSDLQNDSGFITNTVNNLTNYYLKTETYNKTEVDNLISQIATLQIEVVQTLPTHDISTNTIYLVPKQSASGQDVYDEYIYINNAWELIGDTEVDLSNYYTKTETEGKIDEKINALDVTGDSNIGANKTIKTWSETDGKVSITTQDISITKSQISDFSHSHGNITNGGALQTNDITIANGDKLVVTDASNSNKMARTSVAFDGSTTSTALTPKGTFEAFVQDANYVHTDNNYTTTEKNKLSGIESGAEVNVQSDWNITDDTSDAFIKNKPTIPTVNNATLTIQRNGTNIKTFTANSSTDVTANIIVPTKTSDLTNDSGFVTTDENVKQSPTTENKNYRVLLSDTNDDTEHIEGAKKNSEILVNPSLGQLRSKRLRVENNEAYNVTPLIIDMSGRGASTAGQVVKPFDIIYKTSDGTNTYTRTVAPVCVLGNNANNTNNNGVLLGSPNGTTIVGAGESSRTYSTQKGAYNDENLYLTADSSIILENGLSNDSTTSSAKLSFTANGTWLSATNGVAGTAKVIYMGIGNTTDQSAVGNSYGVLRIYDKGTKYSQILTNSLTADRNVSLPDKSGTIAITTDISDAIGLLDGNISGTPSVSKTLTAFSQTDGVVSATFGNIQISESQITNLTTDLDNKVDKVSGKGLSTNDYTTAEKNKLEGIEVGAEVNVQADWNQTTITADDYIKNKPSTMPPSSHTHGNIQNGGTLQTTDITIANGDKLVVTDASDSNKVARTSISFDGSTTNKCLTQKGTWESFTNTSGTVTSVKVGDTTYNPTSGVVSLPAYPSDTKNTAGSTNTSSKIFLIGATSQATNPQTYSHDTAYVGTDGCLYSDGTKVLTAHQDISGKLDKTSYAGLGSVSIGANRWVDVATLTVTQTYADFPIMFEVSGRGIGFTRLCVRFKSVNGTDPDLSLFITDNNPDFYIKKISTSTWKVYYYSPVSYGSLALHRISGFGANNKITVTVNLTVLTEEPTDTTQVVYGGNSDYATSAGSATSATTATKLGSSDVGTATNPIYLASGTATACTYELNKTVPSNAIFTDEKVAQTDINDSNYYRVLLSGTNNDTTTTEGAKKSTNLRFSSSNGTLQVLNSGATSNNKYAQLQLAVKDTTTSQTTESHIRAYSDHRTSSGYGNNLVINSGNTLILGSGEAGDNHYTALGANYQSENLFVTSDSSLHLQGNAQTIADRKGFLITTGHELVPEVADIATNNTGSIGTNTYKFANGYFTNINGVAVGTPEFTDTKNTAGSTNTSSKIYLIGATSQGANPQTYSDDEVYTTSGTLTSKKTDTKAIIARTGTGTAGSTSSDNPPVQKPTKWTFDADITVANGEVYLIKIPEAGGTYGVWASLNNGINYYPVAVSNGKSRFTTHYAKNTVIAVTYESAGKCTCYPLAGGTSTSDVTGIFRVLNDYDANTTYSAMSSSELTTGTATTSRVVRADYLKTGINSLIDTKINALDGGTIGTGATNKTITSLSQTNGNVSATFSNIALGNITSAGALQSTGVAIATGDALVVTDNSNSAKVAKTTVTFDTSVTDKCLTQAGTWASFTNTSGTVTKINVNGTDYSPSSGVVTLPNYPQALASISINTATSTLNQFVGLITNGGNGLCWSGNINLKSDIGFGITGWVRVIAYGQNAPNNGTWSVNISVLLFTDDGYCRQYFITGATDGSYVVTKKGKVALIDDFSNSGWESFQLSSSTSKTVSLGCSTTTSWLYLNGNSTLVSNTSNNQALWIGASSENEYKVFLGVASSAWTFKPNSDNKLYLGASDSRWRTVYAVNGTINTSDRNQKKYIKDLGSFAKDFIMSLKPVSYKFKNTEKDSNHDRTHYGLIAQDVEETMKSFGMTDKDFGGFCKDPKTKVVKIKNENGEEVEESRVIEGEYIYGLRYEEFIAPLIKTVQLQQQEIDELKEEIKLLKSK